MCVRDRQCVCGTGNVCAGQAMCVRDRQCVCGTGVIRMDKSAGSIKLDVSAGLSSFTLDIHELYRYELPMQVHALCGHVSVFRDRNRVHSCVYVEFYACTSSRDLAFLRV